MNADLRLIQGARVVSPAGVEEGDILIQGEWVVAVGQDLPAQGAELIPARGLIALPGGIDAHVHLREPGAEHKEGFTTGTRAALAGGFTTVLDMPNSPVPTVSRASFQAKLELARAEACCDFGLYLGATADNAAEAAGLTEAVGLKLYMGSSTGDLLVADLEEQWEHFATYPADLPLAVHAEDERAVRLFTDGERRPPICAELAVTTAIALARRARRRLHLCHLSTAVELEAAALAKQQGVAVTIEVSPHHLFLTQEDEGVLGSRGIMNPPLRSEEDRKALWRGLDQIDIIASDHAPHTLEEKAGDRPPAGVPGLETTLPLLLDAVSRGELSLGRLASLTSARPAAIFGLPHKGRIAPGYHADITLVDPKGETVLGERLYTKCAWTPFADWRVQGRIERVLLRGRDAVVAGEVLAQPGWGHFLTPRRP